LPWHLQGFLLRHDRIYRGARAQAFRRWLTTVSFEHPAEQIVLQDYIHAVEDAQTRRDRLTRQIEEVLRNRSMAPVFVALRAMRGVVLVAAVTVVAEVETSDASPMLFAAAPRAVLEEEVHVSNFVEVKAARLRKGAKANHLFYIGRCRGWRAHQSRSRGDHLQL
jgi:bifunctional N-acetylglucosamine-1-phosphate-uridyltransferase/glucosamine-1-phosphate-acetyltransferase GlmU-like protein